MVTDLLTSAINPQELKDVVFEMDSSKAPGFDGFDVGLFQKHWSTFGNDITNCFSNFFQDGKLLKEVNHILIHGFRK